MPSSPFLGLSLMLEPDFVRATLPLFDAGQIDVVEWSFDLLAPGKQAPDWAEEILLQYADAGRLLAHGVRFSILSAEELPHHAQWLGEMEEELDRRRYLHLSEHFGFMLAGAFHQGAPLPVPRSETLLAMAHDRLRRMKAAAGIPIGLENLAFSFCMQDAIEHGELLEELLSPVDGFVLLDLHNLFCQSMNFGLPMQDLLSGYPLARVRELHLSGGSWSECSAIIDKGRRIRRDTHDGAVPIEILEFLPLALEKCPNVQAVILERLGGTLQSEIECDTFRDEFRRIRSILGMGA